MVYMPVCLAHYANRIRVLSVSVCSVCTIHHYDELSENHQLFQPTMQRMSSNSVCMPCTAMDICLTSKINKNILLNYCPYSSDFSGGTRKLRLTVAPPALPPATAALSTRIPFTVAVRTSVSPATAVGSSIRASNLPMIDCCCSCLSDYQNQKLRPGQGAPDRCRLTVSSTDAKLK